MQLGGTLCCYYIPLATRRPWLQGPGAQRHSDPLPVVGALPCRTAQKLIIDVDAYAKEVVADIRSNAQPLSASHFSVGPEENNVNGYLL